MHYDLPFMNRFDKAVILGGGGSGLAAAALLHSEGAQTLVLSEPDCGFSAFQAHLSSFKPQVAIVSPGFALTHAWIVELKRCGIPLLPELELGWSRFKGRTVAVTGSNGKSTVVKWLADALTQAGHPAVPCGNYGLPVSEAVMRPDQPDWLVIEVSSFQLETVQHFRPDVGVLLNVLPNHLDRHGNMDTYRNLKLRLFENMTAAGTAVLPFGFFQGLEKTREIFPGIGKKTQFTPPLFPGRGILRTFGTEAGAEYRFANGAVGPVDLSGTCFDNEVLGAAAAAVVAAGGACGLSPQALEASARDFEPLPHRMQTVAEINGVRFIDDSKATNLAAMCAAVRMVKGPVHLIAGGRPKETDLSFAKDLLAQQVSRLYLIGEASGVMQSAWGDRVSCLPCGTLEKAVSAAWSQAKPGESVLLSPACTSFDQFRSFAERGEVFVRAVDSLMPDKCVKRTN